MKKLRHLARKILLATLFISFGLTSSILIADSNAGTITNVGGAQVQARYLPESSFNTPGFTPLELTISNVGNEPLTIDTEKIGLEVISPLKVNKIARNKNRILSKSRDTALVVGSAFSFLAFITSSLRYNLLSGLASSGLTFLVYTPLVFCTSLFLRGLARSKKNNINRIRKKALLGLAQNAFIAPHSIETLTYFVESKAIKRNFELKLSGDTTDQSVTVYA